MTKKILLVDDSKTQRATIKINLEHNGYEVIEADNGMEAIKLVYETMPDLVISDVLMPSINGYHLCRLIKRDKVIQHIPVILLTVLDKKIDKFWGLRAGADAFFSKDEDVNELYLKIDFLLNQNIHKNDFISYDATNYDFTSKVAEILDESLVKSTLTNEFRDLAEFVSDEKVFYSKLFSLLSSILDYNLIGIFSNDSSRTEKTILFGTSQFNVSENVLQAAKTMVMNRVAENSAKMYSRIKTEYKIFEDNAINVNDPMIDNISEFHSEFIMPIEDEGKVIGALALFHVDDNQFVNTKILSTIITELKMAFKIKWLYSETKLLSVIDPLTELYNRRYFQQVLDKEFLRSNRYKSPLSVAMIDIDNFKTLNDTYGHQFGDEVLQVISALFQDSLRKTDYVARYGGEELIAILPETTIEQSIIPLERLRYKVATYPFMYDCKRLNVTVSIGISHNNFKFPSTDAFIKESDKALYEAKEKGKNRIELAINR